MKQNVIVKGNIHKGCKGFTLTLSPDLPFESLKEEIAVKFDGLKDFLKDNKMAVAIEGRKLSPEEEAQVLDIITDHTSISILYVLEQESWKDSVYDQLVAGNGMLQPPKSQSEEVVRQTSVSSNNCYRGTLRSGQLVESQDSVVIVGDVNPGGKVVSCGNIIILGSLKGIACAGVGGNKDAFVAALEMSPMQIQIDNIVAKGYDRTKVLKTKLRKKREDITCAKIAVLRNENIYIENLNKEGLANL